MNNSLPERIVGWCTGVEPDPADPKHPKYWYLYLHTDNGAYDLHDGHGHYRIDGLTFPTEGAARRWAINTLRGLTEYE